MSSAPVVATVFRPNGLLPAARYEIKGLARLMHRACEPCYQLQLVSNTLGQDLHEDLSCDWEIPLVMETRLLYAVPGKTLRQLDFDSEGECAEMVSKIAEALDAIRTRSQRTDAMHAAPEASRHVADTERKKMRSAGQGWRTYVPGMKTAVVQCRQQMLRFRRKGGRFSRAPLPSASEDISRGLDQSALLGTKVLRDVSSEEGLVQTFSGSSSTETNQLHTTLDSQSKRELAIETRSREFPRSRFVMFQAGPFFQTGPLSKEDWDSLEHHRFPLADVRICTQEDLKFAIAQGMPDDQEMMVLHSKCEQTRRTVCEGIDLMCNEKRGGTGGALMCIASGTELERVFGQQADGSASVARPCIKSCDDDYMRRRTKGIHITDTRFAEIFRDFTAHTDDDRWPATYPDEEARGKPKDGAILMSSKGYRKAWAVKLLQLPIVVDWPGKGCRHEAAAGCAAAVRNSFVIIRSQGGEVCLVKADWKGQKVYVFEVATPSSLQCVGA